MSEQIKILDHGYIRLVECWGHGDAGVMKTPETDTGVSHDMECGIIEAARQSTQASFRGWEDKQCPICKGKKKLYSPTPHSDTQELEECYECDGKGYIPGDARLLRYLYNNKPPHSSPFEFAGCTIEVQAPIFVFREWHRHRTQSYSEMSARYSPLPDLNYIPTVERLLMNSKTNKQSGALKGSEELTVEGAEIFRRELQSAYDHAETLYQQSLKAGVPKELARVMLPVGRYSRMRATGNLLNWLKFMTLRADPGAQYEIRMYAYALGTILHEQFPRVYELYAAARKS